jgi:hypothetical protein
MYRTLDKDLNNKIGKVYSTEYTKVLKVFFMPHPMDVTLNNSHEFKQKYGRLHT